MKIQSPQILNSWRQKFQRKPVKYHIGEIHIKPTRFKSLDSKNKFLSAIAEWLATNVFKPEDVLVQKRPLDEKAIQRCEVSVLTTKRYPLVDIAKERAKQHDATLFDQN